MALNYLDKAAWDAGVYKDKGNDDDTQQDTSSEDSGYSASGILSAAKNFLEHPFQGMGTVIAPNYTPRPLDDSVYSDIPGTPVASGQFGELEDESVRDERMKDSADYMAANWPRLYGGVVAADEGLANVVGGIQNAVGGGNGILTNVQRAEEGMQNYRDQWNNEYGDSYFLNPNKFATDAGSVIGSSVPIMGLSALMPGAAVAGGTRALTSALSRAGLGRLAMSEAGQALIADTVRSPISSLADSLSEYGTVVNDMMQNGMSEDEARRRAIPMFFKNMALDTFTVPLELGVMKGGKGIATGLLGRSAEEGVAKSIAKGAARTGMLAGASGLTEGYQEGAQNALENDVEGKRDGGWYNPFTWTNEDWESARGGFVGGALMGVPGNVAAGFHPEAKQAPLSAESQEQVQGIKDTLSHGKPAGMSNAAYNAYIELANSGNPDLIKQAASSLESFQQSQEGSQESTDDAATEAYKDYETYDQKQKIENFLDNNTVEQIGGEKNFNWLMGVLRNGTPEEVQHAYDTVIAAEKATAEQEAKNRPASGGGSMSPNTGNAMANIVIQAANDSGVEPRLGLAIAARESGGDDVNAISMPEPHDGVYGVMQAQEETVSNMGLDSQYPDWKTDPYQNAMVGMAILKAKIDGENGDVWAGVRDYDGAGEEAEQYRQLVKNNYDNMGNIGGGGSGNVEAPSEAFYDLSEAMNPQVDGMDPNTMAKMNLLARDFYQKYGHRLLVTSLKRNGDGSSYHDEGHAFDFSDDFLEQNPDARDWLVQQGEKYGLKGLDEFSHPVATTDGGNVHFTDHGGSAPGGASSGVSGKVTSDNGQFERELDQAAQEAKSDMDKIQAQSDQAMNEIMNDDSTEKTAQDAQQDAENAQKQAEEGQQSVQDDVVPDVAQTIRDTSNNIDEINTLDGMFTKDSNGNDKFIDTPENRDFIKANYKDEIAKAVNDAMSKKKSSSATLVPKAQQQTPHARLGRILSTYDRKDPKFKEYMNTFRNGTEQEQQKLADDLQTTQELERANYLKGNPLATPQDQNAPQNAPQQAVESPKQPEQVNAPAQVKESLETQKKRKIYLAKKQKLMERVPAGKTVKVHASANDAGFDATYKIVPAGDITASHDMNYAVNDLYPAEYQPRDRNRPQMRGQVEKMTKGMKPELLAESQFVNEGAPVVNNSGVVLNGNGRVMAVQKAYKGLADAHKKSAKAYKGYLVSIAPSLGIAPEKVQSMEHPVLVRQAADDADTSAIINSTEGGAKLGGAEQAKADADRLKLSTLEQFVDNGTGEFMNTSNREFRRAAASDVFSDAEGNSVFNEKGDLSPTGAFRIRNAIFAKAYNDNYLLTQLSEATDNNSKNIINAMIAAAPEVAKVNEGIKNGTLYPDYDISDVITKTAKTIMSLRNEGKPLSFHLQETDLFSQGGSEAERLVLEFIERNKFKSRTIADMYKGACDRIFAVGSPKQSKLFDSKEAPRISLENIISNAIQEVEHGQSLFDTTEEKPAEKVVSEVPDNRQAEPAGSGRIHQQEAGRVQSQEKEGNEVDEKSKQGNNVDTEPQQTESKDKESTHAEEGSQGDVQEEVSKFHNVLDDEKSTPKQVIDAYKSVVDKVIANANGSRKNAKIGDKIVTDEYQSLTNSKHWNAFVNEDGGRNWHEVATINADAHKTLRAIIKVAGVKAKETPSSQGIAPYKQAVDDIMDKLAHKKLTPAQAINKLKTIMKDANAARWGEFKAMEAIESKEKLSFDDYKMALDLANDAMKKANDMRLEASRKRKARKTEKELESATEETNPAEQSKEKAGFTDDEINTLTDRGFKRWTKKLSNGKVMDRLYIKPEYLGLELTRHKSGNISSATFNGERISNSEARRIEGTKCYVDVATKEVVCDREDLKQAAQEVVDDALKAKSQQEKQAPKEVTKTAKELESATKETQNDADIRFGTVEDAEARGRIDIAADDVNELFDRIEDMDMPERLDMSDEKKQASIRKASQQLTRSKEDLKVEIKEAFPNAKEIKDEGDHMTFTMPNGSHIVVDVKNEILLTDEELAQAKKDHHIDDNGNVVVEGYAQLHGKDAYMALSQGSRENTGFHEAYHLAEGAVLTDREKAAIKKAIPDAEKRADKYAEWVEARKHGRGTAWGKLFQKIKDFAAKMRKIFTRVENVHDVFRQIESGEVWERNAKTSNVAWTSVTNTAITGKTRVPIVDVSNWGRMNLTNTAKKKAIIEELKGASFKFIDSQGRFATKLDSKHFVNSSSSIQIHLKTRQKIFSNIGEILNNAIYVEKHPDVRHGKYGEYIELFSAVKDGGKIVLFRIVAKEGDKTVGRYNIGDVKFYDILQQKKDVPHHLSHSDRQNGGTSLDTVSVSDLLRNVNDRHNRPYVNSDGSLNYEFGVLKALPTNKTSYSVRKEGATNSTIDQEEAPVKPQDIIDAINDIVHIYEGSRLTDKERKELKEASQFDPDQKQAVRPQATDLYDRHAHAGFNRMGYFNLSNYGRILALHLDNVMQLKGNLELANKVLDRQDKNAAENKMNGVNEHLTPAQARQNAVMDFGAMMIRNPELARETYPAYSKIFDEGLEQHPDLKEKLDKVIQLNETYQGQTAAERAAGSIAREKEKVQLRKHPKEWLHTHFDKFYTNWVDDKHAFAKVVARAEAELGRKLAYDYDVHKQAQMAINVASSRALLFLTGGKGVEETYKVLNKVYGHAITKNVTMKDIMDALNKVSKEDVSKTGAENAYDALGNYLIAMRTEELEKHYHDAYARSAGFDEEGTREIIQNTPESIKKIAQMYWDINTNIVNILQQQGLISKDLAGKLRKYKHYCPMYRDMSDGITDMDEMIGTIGVFNKGGGYANVSNGIKRIEGGGKRPILDPITSLSQMAVSMISKCERNDVAKTFVKLGQDFSGLGDVVVRDPTLKHADPTAFAFTVWQNGEQVVYRTTPEIYDALTNNDAQTNRFTIKMASSIAQTLRTGATISPSFIVRNLLRDTMSATVNSKTGFYLPFVDNVRGAWKLHFDKEFSAEYHASGASMSTYMRADADSSRDLTKELLGHKYDSYPVVVKQVRQLISYAWHKYEKFGNLIEDSTRAGEFRRARKQGLSIDQAGQLAREITLDFSRHGKKGQMINKYVPFFNATIQGTDKFIRTFKDNPMRAILNTVIWIILPSLGLWAINHDDDWYKELDENTKYTNWAIPLPGGTHLLIPKPQEVGILFGSGIEAVLNQMTGTDPHGMKEWARQYAEAMTPSLYPAVVRPLIEWMTNYSFWTGRNLVPASLQKAPSEMQFTSYTSELAKSLGDTWLAKSIKLSPIAIDNWISGWFGSAGRFIANMLNDPISYVRGNSRPSEPAKYWYEMPVIGSFVRQNGQNSEYVNRMYEIQKDMNDDYERSDAGKQRKGKKSSSNKPKELKQVDTAVSSVSKLNKEIKAIRNDPKKDPDRKRQEIDQRRTKINDLAKKVVLKFDK